MANGEKKGITVKIDAELHAKVREFIEANNMTMAEFVSQALDNELNPKFREDVKNMENGKPFWQRAVRRFHANKR